MKSSSASTQNGMIFHSATIDNPGDHILESHFGGQLDNSEKVQCCMQVHVPDTVPKGEPHNYEKKRMVHGHVDHNIKEFHFKARNKLDERSVPGAPAKGKARSKTKGKGISRKVNVDLHT